MIYSKKEIISAPICVQCWSEMIHWSKKYTELSLCSKPDCPNYGIFQIWQEIMFEITKNDL